jgi:hypothetical protein
VSAGKGDLRRPAAVPDVEVERRWQDTFGVPRRPAQPISREESARRIGQLEMPLA